MDLYSYQKNGGIKRKHSGFDSFSNIVQYLRKSTESRIGKAERWVGREVAFPQEKKMYYFFFKKLPLKKCISPSYKQLIDTQKPSTPTAPNLALTLSVRCHLLLCLWGYFCCCCWSSCSQPTATLGYQILLSGKALSSKAKDACSFLILHRGNVGNRAEERIQDQDNILTTF